MRSNYINLAAFSFLTVHSLTLSNFIRNVGSSDFELYGHDGPLVVEQVQMCSNDDVTTSKMAVILTSVNLRKGCNFVCNIGSSASFRFVQIVSMRPC